MINPSPESLLFFLSDFKLNFGLIQLGEPLAVVAICQIIYFGPNPSGFKLYIHVYVCIYTHKHTYTHTLISIFNSNLNYRIEFPEIF